MKISSIRTYVQPVDGTNIVGKASCIINDTIAVNNITVRLNNNTAQLYIQMPQKKNAKTNKYQDIAFPTTKETRSELSDAIIGEFTGESQAKSYGLCNNKDISARMYKANSAAVVGRGSITIGNEFAVKDVKMVQGQNGDLFVAFPDVYNKKTQQNFALVAPADKDAYLRLKNAAVSSYNELNRQSQQSVFMELSEQQLQKVSKSTNVKFDVVKNTNKPDSYIAKFATNDVNKVNAALQTGQQQRNYRQG